MSYRQVKDTLWTGEVAEALRGDADGWTVANYILHGPESCTSSIAVFRMSIATLSDAVGIPSERCSEALRRVCATGFAVYDERFRMCWVRKAAEHRYGDRPNPGRNEVKGLIAALPGMVEGSKSFIWSEFHDFYADKWAPVFEAAWETLPDVFRTPSERRPNAVGTGIETGNREEGKKDSPPCKPPPGGDARKAKAKTKAKTKANKGNVRRDIKADEIESVIIIPDGLRGVPWFTRSKLAERIRLAKKTKSAGLWERELRVLAAARATHGDEIAATVLEVATDKGWNGITRLYVDGVVKDVQAGKYAGGRKDNRSRDERRLAEQNEAIMAPAGAELIDVQARLGALSERLPDWVSTAWKSKILCAGMDAEQAEGVLSTIEAELVAKVSPAAKAEAEAHVVRAVAKLRSRLTGAQIDDMAEELRYKHRREVAGIPELSIFSTDAVGEEGER